MRNVMICTERHVMLIWGENKLRQCRFKDRDQRTILDWRKTDCDDMRWTELARDNVNWQALVVAVLGTWFY
jgi:hypothetical protein